MHPPDDPWTCEIGRLYGLFLCLRCPRGKIVDYPMRLMVKRYHPWIALRSIVPRLRCRCCDQRPVSVVLAETPYRSPRGMTLVDPGWKIQLVRERSGGYAGKA